MFPINNQENNIKYSDFDNICRFCLQKFVFLKPLFSEDDGVEDDFASDDGNGNESVTEMLLLCTGIEIAPNDNLPHFTCSNCLSELLQCNKFRRKCLQSKDVLKKALERHKNNPDIEGINDAFDAIPEEQSKANLDIEIILEPEELKEIQLKSQNLFTQEPFRSKIEYPSTSCNYANTEIENFENEIQFEAKCSYNEMQKRKQLDSITQDRLKKYKISEERARNIQIPERSYSEVEHYQCPLCNKTFFGRETLKIHLDIHKDNMLANFIREEHHMNEMGNAPSDVDDSANGFYIKYNNLKKLENLQKEFNNLRALENDQSFTYKASERNRKKNRYSNIAPYDKNRVILERDEFGLDYINASFINGYKKEKEYISTQGPIPESLIDFWKMILQYKVSLILMLTPFKEGNTIKCDYYFPVQIDQKMKVFNNIIIRCTKKESQELYDRRELIIENSAKKAETSKIIHYYFKKWPDHGCPTDPNDLISFIDIVKSEKISTVSPTVVSPIVVHCSAGVGRTGTFIALDIIMQRLKNEGKINIFETVKNLRLQRMKMVQSIQQYEYLYNCSYKIVKKDYEERKFKQKMASIAASNSKKKENS